LADVRVRLQPRAWSNELRGFRDDGVLIASVTAPPVDGKANAALIKLIAKHADVAPSRVSIVKGENARDKLVRIDGLDAFVM
jgi:uncharacterized protein (TIGR00251 family)